MSSEYSDEKWQQAQQIAESREEYVGDWTWNGQTLPLKTNAPSVGELEDIEERLEDAGQEEEVMRELVGDYLVKPEIDANTVDAPKLGALFAGMQMTWSDAIDTSELEESMPVEGNR